MKFNVLKKALESYLSNVANDVDERNEALEALNECYCLMEHFYAMDTSRERVYVVTSECLRDLMFEATYDIYGKRAKKRNGVVSFDTYKHEVRAHSIEGLTNKHLMFGYDIISDVWSSNEESGNNNEDGTLNRVRP